MTGKVPTSTGLAGAYRHMKGLSSSVALATVLYVTGEHKGFWSWALRAVALGMVKEGSLTAARLEKLVAGMNETDASPDTLVAHCLMH